MKDKTNQEKSIRIFLVPVILISLLTVIDQFTKFVVQSTFELYETKPFIDGFMSFTYIQNKGMAWGMFQNKIPVFLIFTLLCVVVGFKILYNVADNKRYVMVKYVDILLIAGALGNFIDRLTLGYVVDFFDVEFMDFPIFNVADIYVVVSMIAAIILLIFVYSNEELDEILRMFGKSKEKIDEDGEEQ